MVGGHKVLQAVQREGTFGEGVSSAHEIRFGFYGVKKGSFRLSSEAKNRRTSFDGISAAC